MPPGYTTGQREPLLRYVNTTSLSYVLPKDLTKGQAYMPKVLITGGAGFIGSHMARHFVRQGYEVIIADKFSYAAKGRHLEDILSRMTLLIGDLAMGDLAQRCAEQRPDYVIHMAANTHVDRAIADPESFMYSNVIGTTRLLQALYLQHVRSVSEDDQKHGFQRKIIVYSTDEVFGSTPAGVCFNESAPFRPSNAYSASKMGVEGIASSFFVTHTLPIVVVRPCNTYGAGQHPEKVIPKFVSQLLRGESLTVYNDGRGARDWLHVEDHARAIEVLCSYGVVGESYNLAAGEEHSDLDIALHIVEIVTGKPQGGPASIMPIVYQPGRPGHDKRYAMDGSKLRALGWSPQVEFAQGFAETVRWNMAHANYWDHDLVRIMDNV